MKCASAFFAVIGLSLTACDTMTSPISSGDFDPLRPPGSESSVTAAVGPSFKAGQFVRTVMDNTAFFKNRPKGNADADKLLSRGMSMKVISTSDSYVKVELDSGEVGYVPSVMVEDPNEAITAPAVNPGEFQVYPPLGGFSEPLPFAAPSEQPPEGAIPTVIDPEAPVLETPPASTRELAPLPPNGEVEEEVAPTVETPAVETPAVEAPAVEAPAVETPKSGGTPKLEE
jgi:hypothetical protein